MNCYFCNSNKSVEMYEDHICESIIPKCKKCVREEKLIWLPVWILLGIVVLFMFLIVLATEGTK